MAETKMERLNREHLDYLRGRLLWCERFRPEHPHTESLRGTVDMVEQQARDRAAFAAEFGLSEYRWTGGNLSRLLRATLVFTQPFVY